ncbi:MAG: ammonium transporter, partial [Pseudomonadota bacterium]|nr:ammonium transporter [Pseudomonadota bacterium]
LITQIIGAGSICIFVFVLSLLFWYILDMIMGIRVSEEDELNGLDTSELGMEAYPDFSKS